MGTESRNDPAPKTLDKILTVFVHICVDFFLEVTPGEY